MLIKRTTILLITLASLVSTITHAADPGEIVRVTPDNFRRAESDRYFAGIIKDGGLGKLFHRREPASVENQTVIRLNRDTLYTSLILDLDAGPAKITLPDPGTRFRSLQVIDEDQYTAAVIYKPGTYTIARLSNANQSIAGPAHERIPTRYVAIAIRTLVDPNNPEDLKQAHALQDATQLEQAGPGAFEIPRWEQSSQKKVRDPLLLLGETLPDTRHMFGSRADVDPVRHLIGTAMAWGGNPEKDALYLTVTPPKNDGKTLYKLNVKDVPVDGFWSVSVYNAQGYFQPNPQNAYTLNNITAKKDPDGGVTILFGGCDGVANCLPITPGWNYTVRLYRPRPEILNNSWIFPPASPAQ